MYEGRDMVSDTDVDIANGMFDRHYNEESTSIDIDIDTDHRTGY